MPASHSMISDLYQPHERAGAMSAMVGRRQPRHLRRFSRRRLYRSSLRLAHGFLSPPGCSTLAVALLARLTVVRAGAQRRCAQRGVAQRAVGDSSCCAKPSPHYGRTPRLRHVIAGATITAVVGYGTLTWAPSYLVRTHGLSLPTVGAYLAIVIGVGGAIGAFVWRQVLRSPRPPRYPLVAVARRLRLSSPPSRC